MNPLVMDACVINFQMGQHYRHNTFLWDLSGDLALDSYVELTEILNATKPINSQGAFTPELELLSTSSTQMEFDSTGAILLSGSSTATNLTSVDSTPAADWLTGIAKDDVLLGDLKNGEHIALVTLGNLDNPRSLDGLTADAAVSTNDLLTGTSWRVFEVSEGIITIENQGVILPEDYHLSDELTIDGTVGLASHTDTLYPLIEWKDYQVNDVVVTSENQSAVCAANYHSLDGLTADGTVSTNNLFTSTRWSEFNPSNGFGSYNPIVQESSENVTPKSQRKTFEILEGLYKVLEYFTAVIGFERGGSYSSSERDESSGSVGLIQFTDNDVQHSYTRGLASR